MRKTRAKQLHRMALVFSNPRTQGLFHQGKVELFRDEKADDRPWMIRIFQRQWAKDSQRSQYKQLKRMYTAGKLKPATIVRVLTWFDKIIGANYGTQH